MLGAMSPFENMSTLNVVVGIVFIVLTLLLLIPGALASTGKLPGNKWFGLHVPAVRKDRGIWDQAHKVAGPFWVLAGVALAFGAAFAFISSGWMWLRRCRAGTREAGGGAQARREYRCLATSRRPRRRAEVGTRGLA